MKFSRIELKTDLILLISPDLGSFLLPHCSLLMRSLKTILLPLWIMLSTILANVKTPPMMADMLIRN